jgi:hypothetical protein
LRLFHILGFELNECILSFYHCLNHLKISEVLAYNKRWSSRWYFKYDVLERVTSVPVRTIPAIRSLIQCKWQVNHENKFGYRCLKFNYYEVNPWWNSEKVDACQNWPVPIYNSVGITNKLNNHWFKAIFEYIGILMVLRH